MNEKNGVPGILGKLIIEADLVVKTGLHIGAGNDFSSIGAVDNVVVRDTLTRKPYIPGSSLKGKMRYLLARVYSPNSKMKKLNEESPEIGRLFGQNGKEQHYISRLQFQDIFFNEDSAKVIERMDTDLYLTEIKFENTIDRIKATANPRQLERIPAGSKFDFKLIYNVENEDDLEKDLKNISRCLNLLKEDYLGGHGTRGYGRVDFENLRFNFKNYGNCSKNVKSLAEKTIKVG